MPLRFRSLMLVPLLAVAACTTSSTGPVQVTRFHLGGPGVAERGTVAIEPAPGVQPGMEFDTYGAAVAQQLQGLGYAAVDKVAQSLYVAVVDVRTGTRESERRGSGVSIGLGGGTGGFGSGVGGGVSFGLGGDRGGRLVVGTQLSVQLKRRSDQTIVWEGRARGEASERDSGGLAQRLADALFRGFPGESGRTISVP